MSVITRSDGAILLVRHSYLDGWSFPGGLINRHEDFEDALRREPFEEVGLRIDLVGEPVVTLDPDDQIVRIVHRGCWPWASTPSRRGPPPRRSSRCGGGRGTKCRRC